jgi:LacI family transcriptional regulator
MAAIADLDYQQDYTGTSLRRRSTMTIAFLVRDVASNLFADMVTTCEAVLGQAGYSVILANSNGEPGRDAENIRMLSRRRVDGLIASLSSESDRDTTAALRAFRGPIVLIDRTVPQLHASIVSSDHFGGVAAATEHLVRAGRARIGFVSGPNDVLAVRERVRGYKAGLRAEGAKFDRDLVRLGSYDEEFGREQVGSLLRQDPAVTGIIAGGATLGYGALRALKEAGRRVPEDVALVICDGWRYPDLFLPMPLVVSRDAGAIGRVAADLMLESISGGTHRTVELPTELVLPLGARL